MERTKEESAYEESLQNLDTNYTKVDEIPFDFDRRRMSVVVADKTGKTQLITKGAIEEMLSISTYVEYKGVVRELDDNLKMMLHSGIIKGLNTYEYD